MSAWKFDHLNEEQRDETRRLYSEKNWPALQERFREWGVMPPTLCDACKAWKLCKAWARWAIEVQWKGEEE